MTHQAGDNVSLARNFSIKDPASRACRSLLLLLHAACQHHPYVLVLYIVTTLVCMRSPPGLLSKVKLMDQELQPSPEATAEGVMLHVLGQLPSLRNLCLAGCTLAFCYDEPGVAALSSGHC